MNTLYNDYESDEDMGFMCAVESAQIEVEKAFTALEFVEKTEALNIRAAEIQCAMESGDFDDLVEIYQEAASDTEDKKQGIIATIWDKIKKFFGAIRDFITGTTKEIDPTEEVEVDTGFIAWVKGILAKIRDVAKSVGSWVKDPKHALLVIGAVTGFTAVVYTQKKRVAKKAEGKAMLDEVNETVKAVEETADTMKNSKDPLIKELGSVALKLGENLKGVTTKITSAFKLRVKIAAAKVKAKVKGKNGTQGTMRELTPAEKAKNELSDIKAKNKGKKVQKEAADEREEYFKKTGSGTLAGESQDDMFSFESVDDLEEDLDLGEEFAESAVDAELDELIDNL